MVYYRIKTPMLDANVAKYKRLYHVTDEKLAGHIGRSRVTLNDHLKYGKITLEELFTISELLHTSISDLLKDVHPVKLTLSEKQKLERRKKK